MRYKTILFDLDGTLLDTNELIIQSFLHTLERFCPEKGYQREDIIAQMGLPLREMLSGFHPESESLEAMVEVYREHNIRTHDEMVQAFPHVSEVLHHLHEQGIQMGIVTTKQRSTAEQGLRLCKLDGYLQAVITIDDVIHPKPHPEPVIKAMELLHANPKTTLMVGDSRYDLEAAKQAGVDSAGVAWTLKGRAYLERFSPTYLLEDMLQLIKIVEESRG